MRRSDRESDTAGKLHRARRASIALALFALACGGPARDAGVAVIASGTDLESGDPLVTVHALSRQIQRYALFVTLARYDSTLTPSPYFARSWTWSPDRRALTFRLATDLRWHDGAPTTARDVAFTLDAARDPATGYPRAADLAGVTKVEAPDDSTVVLRFAGPQPAFPLVLCELPIVPAHRLARVPRNTLRADSFSTHPLGNGPFRFVGRTAGQQWRFERNDAFPPDLGGPPALRGLIVAVVDEPTTKFAGLTSGELDMAGIAPTMAALVRRDASLRVVDYPILLANGIVFNVAKAPFDDARVRRAISLSLDRRRIVSAALAGFGTPSADPVPPESPVALKTAASPDTHAADSLFDAAGWRRAKSGMRERNGRPLRFELLTVGSGDNAVEQLVQADLAARGIRMEIRQAEMGTFLTLARAPHKTFDALVTGIPGDLSLAYLGALFDSRQAGGALDYSAFHRPALDALFAAARGASTDGQRVARWRAVQRFLADSVPVAWLYHSRGLQGVSARLNGLHIDLRGELATVHDWSLGSAPR